MLGIFRPAYKEHYSSPYLSTPADANSCKLICELAQEASSMELEEDPSRYAPFDAEDVEKLRYEVIQHWVSSFLSDDNYWLSNNRHPLRCITRDIAKYGYPPHWSIGGGKSSNYNNLDNYKG